jgi:hypothetical protein
MNGEARLTRCATAPDIKANFDFNAAKAEAQLMCAKVHGTKRSASGCHSATHAWFRGSLPLRVSSPWRSEILQRALRLWISCVNTPNVSGRFGQALTE